MSYKNRKIHLESVRLVPNSIPWTGILSLLILVFIALFTTAEAAYTSSYTGVLLPEARNEGNIPMDAQPEIIIWKDGRVLCRYFTTNRLRMLRNQQELVDYLAKSRRLLFRDNKRVTIKAHTKAGYGKIQKVLTACGKAKIGSATLVMDTFLL